MSALRPADAMSATAAKPADYDVVIAGGGLVGGSLAIALGALPLRVALVEAIEPDAPEQPSFDDRTIALSHGSCRILRSTGIWDRLMRSQSCWAIHKIHVSEQGRFGTALIDSGEQGVAELGFVIRSRELGQAIWAHLREQGTVDLLCPAQAQATRVTGTFRTSTLRLADSPREVTSRLLVAADGVNSKLRQLVGISADSTDYGQVAVVANVQVDARKLGHQAYERFTPEGPLALLPGPEGRCTVVMACTAATAAQICAASDKEFLTRLQSAFGYRLGVLRAAGKRSTYPLSLTVAEELIAERAVLVGSAAHGLHPVAAQGFNLGLRDVAALADLLDEASACSAEPDAGDPELLAAYQAWRCDDHRKVVQFTDGLIRGFGVDLPVAGQLRGLALTGFDMLPGAKRALARQTMGLSGRMSRLARGLPV